MSNPTATLSAITVWYAFPGTPAVTFTAEASISGLARILQDDAAYYGAPFSDADAFNTATRLIEESLSTGRRVTEGSEDDIRVYAY